ncbi:unnamed protein product, partial [Rotaria sp. Silwood2]
SVRVRACDVQGACVDGRRAGVGVGAAEGPGARARLRYAGQGGGGAIGDRSIEGVGPRSGERGQREHLCARRSIRHRHIAGDHQRTGRAGRVEAAAGSRRGIAEGVVAVGRRAGAGVLQGAVVEDEVGCRVRGGADAAAVSAEVEVRRREDAAVDDGRPGIRVRDVGDVPRAGALLSHAERGACTVGDQGGNAARPGGAGACALQDESRKTQPGSDHDGVGRGQGERARR